MTSDRVPDPPPRDGGLPVEVDAIMKDPPPSPPPPVVGYKHAVEGRSHDLENGKLPKHHHLVSTILRPV